MTEKKVLIVQGGWDGHEPQLTSKRFARLMEKHGYSCEISDTLDVLADGEALKKLDLIVACWTMGEIKHEYVQNVSKAVGAGVGSGVLRSVTTSGASVRRSAAEACSARGPASASTAPKQANPSATVSAAVSSTDQIPRDAPFFAINALLPDRIFLHHDTIFLSSAQEAGSNSHHPSKR